MRPSLVGRTSPLAFTSVTEAAVATVSFADRLAAAVVERRSQLVIGLDPQLDLLPVELRGDAHTGRAAAADAYERFCTGLVDAVAPYVVACYHNPYEGIEDLYIPSTVPYARSAFAHPLGTTYSNPREVSVDLPLRHGARL